MQFILLLQLYSAKQLPRQGIEYIMSPKKQQRRPLPFLLSLSFFMPYLLVVSLSDLLRIEMLNAGSGAHTDNQLRDKTLLRIFLPPPPCQELGVGYAPLTLSPTNQASGFFTLPQTSTDHMNFQLSFA